MIWRALLHLARAETRRSRGTLAFCVVSIAIGVASLTAIRGVLDSLEASMAGQSRQILGADLTIQSNEPLAGGVGAELTAELESAGADSARFVSFYSMLTRAEADAGGQRATTLVRVRGVGDGYPFYGTIGTDPPGRWDQLGAAPQVLVDPALLEDLGIAAGDRVRLGTLELEVAGAFAKEPGGPAATFSLAPNIYMHERFLADTGLLQTGSRVRYQRLFRLPAGVDAEDWKQEHWDRAIDGHVTIRTARESASSVQRFLRRLSYFLTVVGLVTLLLGGLGIGSAMNVFIRGKLDNAAVLRCLGARPRQVIAVYAAVAVGVGLLGSLVGVVVGALVPLALGGAAGALGGDLLPADLALAPTWRSAYHGLFAGVVATAAFALVPVWRAGRVSPLRVMRRDVDPGGRGRRLGDVPLLALLIGAVVAVVLGLAAVETGSVRIAAYFTGAVVVSVALLAAAAAGARFLARRIGPRLPGYHLRQGVANLHRPGNQTASVITAIGVGVLLVSTIFIIEASLQRTIAIDERDELPNLFLIDVQPQQRAGVEAILAEHDAQDVRLEPMIAARIAAVNGQSIDRTGVEQDAVERTWEDRMRTREYFVSYRSELAPNEELTAGQFWNDRSITAQEVSIVQDLADNLGAELGDTLTLDIQGIPLDATITSFREIRWQAMIPNAMIVLSPGPIEDAPKMFVGSVRMPGPDARQAVQSALVARYPNLSVVDITEAAETVIFLVGRISAILNFLALLTVITGAVILGGAIAAGRFARVREAMLLKVLGASRRDLRRILVAEYAVLAALGGVCGWLLAELINRPALEPLFETSVVVPYAPLAVFVAVVVLGNVGVGLLLSRGIAEGRPLDVLRGE